MRGMPPLLAAILSRAAVFLLGGAEIDHGFPTEARLYLNLPLILQLRVQDVEVSSSKFSILCCIILSVCIRPD
jgi:hypothetical protein